MILALTYKLLFKNNNENIMSCKEYEDRDVAELEFHYYSNMYDYVELTEETTTRYILMRKKGCVK